MRPPPVILALTWGQFGVALTYITLIPVLLAMSQDLGIPLAVAGQWATIATLVSALCCFAFGSVIDSYPRRRILLIALLLIAASSFVTAIAWDFWIVVIGRVLLGAGFALATPTSFALVSDTVPNERRTGAMAWLTFGMGMVFCVGSPLVAWIAGDFGWRWSFVTAGGSVVLAAVAALIVVPALPAVARRSAGLFQSARRAYVPLVTSPATRGAVLLALFGGAPFFVWQTYLGAFFQQTFGISTGDLAPLLAINGVGFVLGSFLGAPLAARFSRRTVVIAAMGTMGLAIVLQSAVFLVLPISLLLALTQSASESPRIANTNAIMSELAPSNRGALMSLYTALVQTGMTIGALLAGGILELGGYAGLGVFAAAIAFTGMTVVILLVREDRSLAPLAAAAP